MTGPAVPPRSDVFPLRLAWQGKPAYNAEFNDIFPGNTLKRQITRFHPLFKASPWKKDGLEPITASPLSLGHFVFAHQERAQSHEMKRSLCLASDLSRSRGFPLENRRREEERIESPCPRARIPQNPAHCAAGRSNPLDSPRNRNHRAPRLASEERIFDQNDRVR